MIGDARWDALPERTRATRRAEGAAMVGELADLRAHVTEIDLPRASILLAQATGRLIRTANDRGVVAVRDVVLVRDDLGSTGERAVDACDLAPGYIRAIAPYQPGKPISELARELDLVTGAAQAHQRGLPGIGQAYTTATPLDECHAKGALQPSGSLSADVNPSG